MGWRDREQHPGVVPIIAWDVDGVLNPNQVSEPGYVAHRFCGRGPDGVHREGVVHLNPRHGDWMRELTAAGADHCWLTSWGLLARTWLAPRLYPPAAVWPVLGRRHGRRRRVWPLGQVPGAPRRPGGRSARVLARRHHRRQGRDLGGGPHRCRCADRCTPGRSLARSHPGRRRRGAGLVAPHDRPLRPGGWTIRAARLTRAAFAAQPASLATRWAVLTSGPYYQHLRPHRNGHARSHEHPDLPGRAG